MCYNEVMNESFIQLSKLHHNILLLQAWPIKTWSQALSLSLSLTHPYTTIHRFITKQTSTQPIHKLIDEQMPQPKFLLLLSLSIRI